MRVAKPVKEQPRLYRWSLFEEIIDGADSNEYHDMSILFCGIASSPNPKLIVATLP